MFHETTRPQARRGSAITEVLISSILVGVLVVAALNSVGMVFRTRRFNADRLTGPGLARDVISEILAMPYEDPQNPGGAIGVDAGESASTRTTFDDVDDYHNWSTANAGAANGTARSGYTGWAHQATVTWAERVTGTVWASDTGLKRITVTVTSPSGTVTQLHAFRARQGALEQSRARLGTAVTWIGAELRAGASTRSQYLAAPLANHAQDAN
jgi:hypothetical protein